MVTEAMSAGVHLYLMRHGEAVPESEDPSQPLSALGRAEVERMARYLADVGVQVAQIGHSGKLRARETAELLGERLFAAKGIHQVDGLAPMADPEDAWEKAEKLHEPTIWVGHLPHLDRLVSRLLAGHVGCEITRFEKAAIACFVRAEPRWRLCWLLTPDIIRRRV